MITVHIKSNGQVRTEEWDDWRIKEAEQEFVEDHQAYGLEFSTEGGGQLTVIIARSLWELNEELGQFGAPSQQPYVKMPAFVRSALLSIGNVLNEYMAIEPLFRTVSVPQSLPFDQYTRQLVDLRNQSYLVYEQVETVRNIIEGREPQSAAETALLRTVVALSDFALALYNSIKGILPVVVKLTAKAAGKKYEPLEFMTDIKTLEGVLEQREAVYAALRKTQDDFINAFPDTGAQAAATPIKP